MEVECRLVFEYETADDARRVLKSVELDNQEFVKVEVEGNKLVSRINARNLSSLRHTIDDYLACIAIAEKLISRD